MCLQLHLGNRTQRRRSIDPYEYISITPYHPLYTCTYFLTYELISLHDMSTCLRVRKPGLQLGSSSSTLRKGISTKSNSSQQAANGREMVKALITRRVGRTSAFSAIVELVAGTCRLRASLT